MTNTRRLLIVEPYYGGSHRQFVDGLVACIEAESTLITQPPYSWKQRMQTSSPWVARQVACMAKAKRGFDAVLSSTFVDGAVLKSLLQSVPGWNCAARFCTYFHENQFGYPNRGDDPGIRQFQYLNYTTALTANRLAFNSHYNLNSFLGGCRQYLKRADRHHAEDLLESIAGKSVVLPPGLDYATIDNDQGRRASRKPVIVWNHRWEHDKNPQSFFTAMEYLHQQGHDFGLIVLGENFGQAPECFTVARERLAGHILFFGYANDRQDYAAWLSKGNIAVSTAHHEFFGMAVLEAVRAGCRPLLPRRLSYPELFPTDWLYDDGELEMRLTALFNNPAGIDQQTARRYTDPYSWCNLADRYRRWLFD